MPTTNFLRYSLVLYGLLNAALYCSLLPLWEGFDEPFHYGYVQSLSVERRLPVLGETVLSDEIWESLRLAPVSHLAKQNLPVARSYSEYFALPAGERAELRRQLWQLDPGLRLRFAARPPNYEAQQAPLAYLPLAALDWMWRSVPLVTRVWRLRLVCALGSVLLICWGTLRLARRLGVPESAVLFLVLSTQTFYAATAHITNDWLAAPLVLLLLEAALAAREQPGRFALLLALGLLTKAYFLAFVPLALWLLWRQWPAALAVAPAAPWYLRNLLLYGSLSAMHEWVPLGQVLAALPAIPWWKSALAVVRSGLWTANNSFTTFSATTMYLAWGILLVAAVQYGRRRPLQPVLLAGIGCYVVGLVYSSAVKFVVSGGEGYAPSVWYLQPLLAPVLCLLVGAAGRWVTAAMVALWAYIITATWWLKLIPLYGGYPAPRVHLGELLAWYQGPFELASLAPAGLVLALALAALLLVAATIYAMTRQSFSMLCLLAVACGAAFWLGRTTSVEAKADRVFEIRTYTTEDGRLDALHARFRNHTTRIFEKHGMTNIGYWQPADEPLSKNTLIYILAHPSREAAKKAWNDFRNDPEWKKVQAESEASGKIVKKVESVFLDATDYSPLK